MHDLFTVFVFFKATTYSGTTKLEAFPVLLLATVVVVYRETSCACKRVDGKTEAVTRVILSGRVTYKQLTVYKCHQGSMHVDSV